MGYGLAIAGDAEADLRAFEPWLQEEVLDELELLLADPSVLPAFSPENHNFYAFSRVSAGVRHYVTIVLTRNDISETLTVLGLYQRQKQIPP